MAIKLSDFPQSFFLSLGKGGCYFFCLCDVARQYLKDKGCVLDSVDYLATAHKAIDAGYITFDMKNFASGDNFFIKNPVGILEMLTGVKWSVALKNKDYIPTPQDYIVEYWSRDNGKTGHFARTKQPTHFNPLQYSTNVAEGSIFSYRVFRA